MALGPPLLAGACAVASALLLSSLRKRVSRGGRAANVFAGIVEDAVTIAFGRAVTANAAR